VNANAVNNDRLLRRYRIALLIFIAGLVLSGLTAFPLLHEMRLIANWLGTSEPAAYHEFTGLKYWIASVLHGLEQTHAHFPFIAYGTDWLAYGHLAIALFFIRPLIHPLESDWVLRMEDYALLAGTAALFAALGAVMFFTRNVDWFAEENAKNGAS